MIRQRQRNRGFSFVELLIAMTILSIMMIMVVQFMSTSSGAYRKTKKNLNVQTDALQVMEQMSDTIVQANYIRVSLNAADNKAYILDSKTQNDDGTKTKTSESRTLQAVSSPSILSSITYDFVPDNYGNYVKRSGDERKVILDTDTYQLLSKSGSAYPLTGDYDDVADVRSFRALMSGSVNYYVKPEYIYVEYTSKDASGADVLGHAIFYIKKIKTDDYNIYMYRYQDDNKEHGFSYAKNKVVALSNKTDSVEGLLTDKVKDFYMSANSEGNAVLFNAMFLNGGYQYNSVEPVQFRNSNVLTVRPQDLYKKAEESSTTQDPNNGTTVGPEGTTGSE